MIGRFWPLLVIAFVVGSLFRLYTDTGIGFYRMFGTMGIVVLGAVASRIVVRAQLDEGEDLIRGAIAELPAECDVWRLSARGADRAVAGPAGTVILLTSNIAHYARGWGLGRSLEQLANRMARAAEVVERTIGPGERTGAGEAASDEDGDDPGALPVHRAVVFLRRSVRPEDRRWLARHGIDVVEPEVIVDYVIAKTVEGRALPSYDLGGENEGEDDYEET